MEHPDNIQLPEVLAEPHNQADTADHRVQVQVAATVRQWELSHQAVTSEDQWAVLHVHPELTTAEVHQPGHPVHRQAEHNQEALHLHPEAVTAGAATTVVVSAVVQVAEPEAVEAVSAADPVVEAQVEPALEQVVEAPAEVVVPDNLK